MISIIKSFIKYETKLFPYLILIILFGCTPQISFISPDKTIIPTTENLNPAILPVTTRPIFSPGELVDYIAQNGDTLPALASHFNTTVSEIRANNPVLPENVTTLPSGLPLKIPIYYQPLWGSSFQILPDSLFINGPAQIGFDPVSFVNSKQGWFKNYEFFAGTRNRIGGELITHIADNYSISPRVLLAILEYQTAALTIENNNNSFDDYPLGVQEYVHRGLYRQLLWAANTLNNGYYGWRTGRLSSFEHTDGSLERPDPWQNAASVAIQYYFAKVFSPNDYQIAVSSQGFSNTYRLLFGDPWENVIVHIPGSLQQPAMLLPFEAGQKWTYTGGPHTGWGEGDPLSAIDFAPPAVEGCNRSNEWVTAMADGIIARSEPAVEVLDLDGDGDERTGWVVFYLHIGNEGTVPVGTRVKPRQPIGNPSCEGGEATGTHVHIARKYNGEWIPADGPLAFNVEGWVAQNGTAPYQGKLVRYGEVIRACDCSDMASQIQAQTP